jgi:hypothetical protein
VKKEENTFLGGSQAQIHGGRLYWVNVEYSRPPVHAYIHGSMHVGEISGQLRDT